MTLCWRCESAGRDKSEMRGSPLRYAMRLRGFGREDVRFGGWEEGLDVTSHPSQSAEDPARDRASVGHQHFGKHQSQIST